MVEWPLSVLLLLFCFLFHSFSSFNIFLGFYYFLRLCSFLFTFVFIYNYFFAILYPFTLEIVEYINGNGVVVQEILFVWFLHHKNHQNTIQRRINGIGIFIPHWTKSSALSLKCILYQKNNWHHHDFVVIIIMGLNFFKDRHPYQSQSAFLSKD